MNIGEYYGLFACMVTRRSWKSVTSGIKNSQMTKEEKQELRQYAYSLIPQISDVSFSRFSVKYVNFYRLCQECLEKWYSF